MRFPKIPHGVTAFGVGAATASLGLAHKRAIDAQQNNAKLIEEAKATNLKMEDLSQKIDGLSQKMDNVSQSLDNLITKTNKFLPSNFRFTSIKDLKEYLDNFLNFIGNFSIQDQILIVNSLNSFFLLSLLFSFLLGKYGNYLIEKFDLNNRYPKLGKIIYYRSSFQKYYFNYISILAICSLLMNLFINLFILLY